MAPGKLSLAQRPRKCSCHDFLLQRDAARETSNCLSIIDGKKGTGLLRRSLPASRHRGRRQASKLRKIPPAITFLNY
jgi:hypothetical protein